MCLPFHRAFVVRQRTFPPVSRLFGLPRSEGLARLAGVILLIGMFGGPSASAQDSPFRFGVAVGVNLATVDAPANADVGVRRLLAGGAVVQAAVTGPLSVETQLLLEQKGTAVRGEVGGIRYGAAYLSWPLLLRVEAPTIGPVTPYGLAGGFGSLKLFEVHRGGGRGLGPPLDTNTSFFRRTDVGPTGGIGGRISIGRRQLNISLRYAHGLVDVARSIDDQPFEEAPFPSRAETRTVSIMLRLGL